MRPLLLITLVLCIGSSSSAQDGDHPITDGAGRTYLAPDPMVLDVSGTPVAPFNLTVGDAPSGSATLHIRGDQLPVTDPFIGGTTLCTFRTDVPAATERSWWMYRDILRIGRIWNESGHRAFHLQRMLGKDNGQDRYSGLMLQNDRSPQG